MNSLLLHFIALLIASCSFVPNSSLAATAQAIPFEIYFLQNDQKRLVSLPHIWNQEPTAKGQTKGVYEFVIQPHASGDKTWAISLNPKFTQNTMPFRVLMKGLEIYRYGNPDQPDDLTQLVIPAQPLFVSVGSEPLILTVETFASIHSLWPGLLKVSIEEKSQYSHRAFIQSIFAAAVMGAILIVALYHAMIWYLNRKDTAQIVFVAFCIAVFIFSALHLSRFIFQLFDVNGLVFWLLQSFAWYGTMAAFEIFTWLLYPDSYPKRKVQITCIIALGCWIAGFFSLYAMLLFQVYSWYYLAHLALFTYRLPKKERKENLLFALIYGLLLVGAIFDLASGIDLIDGAAALPLCFFGIVCIESYLLSYLNQQTKFKLFEEQLHRQEIEESLQAVYGIRDRIDHSRQSIPGLSIRSVYQPAEKFGGDWLSLTYLSQSKQTIVLIGDVTGHGIGSGLMAVSIGASIHGALSVLNNLQNQLSIEEKLDYIARAIHFAICDISKRLNKGMTFALIGLDSDNRQCVVRNHGHPFPFLVRNGKVSGLIARGALLGQENFPEPQILRFDIQSGDKLFVYTDGLLENFNAKGIRLSRRSMESILRAPTAIAEGVDALADYTYAEGQDAKDADDLAFMLVEWQDLAA